MGAYVVPALVKEMLSRRIQVNGLKVLIISLTFKENCPDLHNTFVVDVIGELKDYGIEVDLYDLKGVWAPGDSDLRL